jgi:Tfp pilus assembly protein PilN
MSVRVNLLPEATRHRDRAARQRAGLGASLVALLLILGGVYLWSTNQVSTARVELAAEEQRTSELQGEVNALAEFRELAARQDEADQALVEALGGEVSVAGVLQDIAAVMPSDAQLETLALNLDALEAGADPNGRSSVGSFNSTGKTLTAHAPGVERFLLELDKVVSFHDIYLNSSALDDPTERVATFTLDGQLGTDAATGRYVDGLPEELR